MINYIPDTNPFTRLVAVGISEIEDTVLYIMNDGSVIPFSFSQYAYQAQEAWDLALQLDADYSAFAAWNVEGASAQATMNQLDYRELEISRLFD